MYYIIRGTFVIARTGVGPYIPDGDTVRFEADDARNVARLPRRGEEPGSPASVRFTAIDALEKDQEQAGAAGARDRMFELLGLGQTSLDTGSDGFRVLGAVEGESRGYLLANGVDKYGRIIAFVFPGDPPGPDGAVCEPDAADIEASVNRTLIEEGRVYATFYSTLSATLRGALVEVSRKARTDGAGLWSRAVGTPDEPAQIRALADLGELVLFPTLHRRLDDYLASNASFDGLAAWIRAEPDSRNKIVRLLDEDTVTDLPGILDTNGTFVRLTRHPESFVFVDRAPTLVPEPAPPCLRETIEAGDVVIAGVLANPPGPERGAEVVTLLNTTGEPVDLAGWALRDNAGSEPLHGVIPGGHCLRVVPVVLKLANAGDRIELVDASGQRVDRVEWTQPAPEGRTLLFPWPRAADS